MPQPRKELIGWKREVLYNATVQSVLIVQRQLRLLLEKRTRDAVIMRRGQPGSSCDKADCMKEHISLYFGKGVTKRYHPHARTHTRGSTHLHTHETGTTPRRSPNDATWAVSTWSFARSSMRSHPRTPRTHLRVPEAVV